MLEIAIKHMPARNNDDHQLLRQIAGADEEALAVLFQRHGNKLYAYALRILGEPADAEDVLQDSLVTVWRQAKSYRAEGRALSWLFGIVHHQAMRRLRKRPHIPLDEGIGARADGDLQVDETVLAQERKQQIRLALEQLSIEHRTVLELVFYHQMSMKEIAQIQGVPLGTVKSRLAYAKESLKGVLTRQGLSEEQSI